MALLLALFATAIPVHGNLCDSDTSLYRIPGNLTLLGLVGTRTGEECQEDDPGGAQTAAALVAATSHLRTVHPQLGLGLVLYETCSSGEMAQKALISALVEANCRQQHLIGGLGGEGSVEGVVGGLWVGRTYSEREDWMTGGRAAGSLLPLLGWSSVLEVPYLAPPEASLGLARGLAHAGVCIHHHLPMDKLGKVSTGTKVLVVTPDRYLKSVLEGLEGLQVLALPTDGVYTPLPGSALKSEVLVMVPETLARLPLRRPQHLQADSPAILRPPPTNITDRPASLRMVQAVREVGGLVGAWVEAAERACPDTPAASCSVSLTAAPTTYVVTEDPALFTLTSAQFWPAPPPGWLLLSHTPHQLEVVGRGGLEEGRWVWRLEVNTTEVEPSCLTNASLCRHCYNFPHMRESVWAGVRLRSEPWVAAVLSVAAVGALSCLAVAAFIAVRMCKRDVLEGHPASSLLLLAGLLAMYLSTVPLSLEADPPLTSALCGAKVFAPSLSFGLAYSVMVARGLLLASCDRDGGFMSHIDGRIQAVLSFFVFAVQVALSLQFWAFNWLLLDTPRCEDMREGKSVLWLMVYNGFLLVVLLCLTPFIARSKRNYYEGAYFTAGGWVSAGVWACWTTSYAVWPAWREVVLSAATVACPTVLLLTVFIPRTYLMVRGIVRDRIVSSLPPALAQVDYRSTQALYDSLAAPLPDPGSNYYLDRPTTPSTARLDPKSSPDNTYERYDSPPSPQNITRF